MDLTGYTIYNGSGIEQIELKGNFSPQSLAEIFIREWIPYYECHKCGRSDYCKYTEPFNSNPNRMQDIKCGVVVDTINNFVNCTFHLLKDMNVKQIQNYLDGAFYLTKFVHDSELKIGMLMDKGHIKFFQHYAPMVFGNLLLLRDTLNSLGSVLKETPIFQTQRGILFVEGKSEMEFLEKLKESRLMWFIFLIIENYHGKGNRHVRKIQMLLDNFTELGYKIYIQGDADGKNMDIFNKIIEKCKIENDCTFVFEHDFETSIPSKLLFAGLTKMGYLDNVPFEDFEEKISSKDCSVIPLIMELYGIDLEPIKIKFAKTIAEILNHPSIAWWQNETFMESELGKFLDFVRRIE
jgi:hypothetical protein